MTKRGPETPLFGALAKGPETQVPPGVVDKSGVHTNTSDSMYTASASPFGRANGFAGAYRQIGVETGVSGASPHHLVTMLFDGLADAMAQARGAILKRDIGAKGKAIGKAVRIIQEGLKGSLDIKGGGQLALDLDALYGYTVIQLTRANLHNDEALVAQCQQLMEPVRQAWIGIGAQVQSQQAAAR